MPQPTQHDVARLAGVSRPLVSLVMRNAPNVSDESRQKILEAAQQLGYRPNAFARALASKQTTTIGVLIHDVTNPYYGTVYASLSAAADRAGYDLLVAPGLRFGADEGHLIETLLEHRVAGLVLLTPLMPTRQMQRVCEGWPTVVIGRVVNAPGIDVVTTDEAAAATAIVVRLVELGHRSVVHISGGANRPAKDRAAAVRKALAAAGLEPLEVNAGEFTEEGGRRGGAAVLAMTPAPTAVVAANDLIAVGAMGVFRSAGLRVPDDISVVGYDDSQIARLDLVQLTSVRQSTDEFGEATISLLTERIQGSRSTGQVQRIEAALVERATTAPARRR